MKWFKITSIICVFLVSFSLLAGCQSNVVSNKPEDSQKDSQNTPKTEEKKQVNLRFSWWGSDLRHKTTIEALELYNKKFPNVKIEGEYSGWDSYYQKLVTQIAGDNAPDLIQVEYSWIPNFALQGQMFEDLNNHKDKIDFSGLDMNFVNNYCGVNKQIHGLPLGLNGSTMIFNKKLTESNGVNLDSNSKWDWETIIEEGKKFKQKNNDAVFFHTDLASIELLVLRPYVIQKTGQQWVTDDYTIGFTKEALTDGLKYIKLLLDQGIIQPIGETMPFNGKIDQNPKWASGNAAFTLRWSSDIPGLTNPNVNIDVSRFPVAKDSKDTSITYKPAMVGTVNKKSSNIDEAVKFLNWMLNDKEAISLLADVRGVPPVSKARDLLVENGKLNTSIKKSLDIAVSSQGSAPNGVSTNSELVAINNDIIQKVAYNKLSPEAAADELIKLYNEKLTALKKN